MQNFLIVEIVDSQGYLSKPIKDLRLTEVSSLLLHLLYLGVHIPKLAVNHDNAKITFVVCE